MLMKDIAALQKQTKSLRNNSAQAFATNTNQWNILYTRLMIIRRSEQKATTYSYIPKLDKGELCLCF